VALPRTLLGELTALPRPSSWIRGRGRRGWEEIREDESGGGRRHGKWWIFLEVVTLETQASEP